MILESGEVFHGTGFGANLDTEGEVVFNTGMTGYQELISDPSYSGQLVTMTYPLIGNYGINRDDYESMEPALKGLIVKELCDFPSNFRVGFKFLKKVFLTIHLTTQTPKTLFNFSIFSIKWRNFFCGRPSTT